jgi:hypothetical protein
VMKYITTSQLCNNFNEKKFGEKKEPGAMAG